MRETIQSIDRQLRGRFESSRILEVGTAVHVNFLILIVTFYTRVGLHQCRSEILIREEELLKSQKIYYDEYTENVNYILCQEQISPFTM